MNVDTTHEDLIARLERDLEAIARTTPVGEPAPFEPARAPLHVGGADRRRPGLLLAAASVAALGLVGLLAIASRSEPEPAPLADAPAPDTTPAASAPPIDCGDQGCVGFDRLPVADGVADYYVGPPDLGEPIVSLSMFDTLTRCVRLSDDFSTCERIEGVAGVPLVEHGPSDRPIVTDGAGRRHSGPVRIGTVFTDISPSEYAASWGPTQQDGEQRPTTVRGHDAVRYSNEVDPALVWQERPGVLVWVAVPFSMESELAVIADGVRRVDGPETIPDRVVVPLLGRTWEAHNNDGNDLLTARAGGQECVGLAFVSRCGPEISNRTIVRTIDDGTLLIVAGSVPTEVSSVRIDLESGQSTSPSLVPFADFDSRFYAAEFDALAGVVRSVTWLDTQGDVVSSVEVDVDAMVGTVPTTTSPAQASDVDVPITVPPADEPESSTTIFPPPPTTAPDDTESVTDTYVVQAGDFPIGVAEKLCVSLVELIEANGWSSDWSEFPMPGSEIAIPAVGSRDVCPDPSDLEPAIEATVFETTTTSLLDDQ